MTNFETWFKSVLMVAKSQTRNKSVELYVKSSGNIEIINPENKQTLLHYNFQLASPTEVFCTNTNERLYSPILLHDFKDLAGICLQIINNVDIETEHADYLAEENDEIFDNAPNTNQNGTNFVRWFKEKADYTNKIAEKQHMASATFLEKTHPQTWTLTFSNKDWAGTEEIAKFTLQQVNATTFYCQEDDVTLIMPMSIYNEDKLDDFIDELSEDYLKTIY